MAGKRFVPCTRFIDKCVRLEDGSPVALADHQRVILDHVLTPRDGRLPYQTVVWSEPKKSGKTAIAAWVASWALNTLGNPRAAEVLAVGNDLEQSQARVFAEVVRVQHAHPALKRRIRKATESLLVLVDGSTLKPVAMDAPGEAGPDPVLVVHDELWGAVSERARRLFDELTPPPTRPLACRWVSSYAGFTNESKTLEDLYERGLKGQPVDGLPDSRANGPLFVFWSHTPRMTWQDERYYAAQRTELRPRAFLRLHENRWVTSDEGAWLPAGLLEQRVDRTYLVEAPLPGVRYRFFADNAGGSNCDMVLCGGRLDGPVRKIVGCWSQDGRPPFDPIQAIRKFAGIMLAYDCRRVWGDTYGGMYYASEYLKQGVHSIAPGAADGCKLSPSQLYEAAEIGFTRGDICLPNHAKLIEQFNSLVAKGEKITPKYGNRHDYSNAASGVLWLLAHDGAYVPRPDLYGVAGQRTSAPASPRDAALIWSSTSCPAPWNTVGSPTSIFDKYDRGELEGQHEFPKR